MRGIKVCRLVDFRLVAGKSAPPFVGSAVVASV